MLLHISSYFIPFPRHVYCTCIVIFMADFLYQYVHGVGEYSIILGTDYNITCKIGCARFRSLDIKEGKASEKL